MPVVSAVRASPTWAAPVMVGAPVAGVFGPGTTSRSPPDSFPPSSVQMAPWAEQPVVAFRSMATSALEPGATVTSQRTFLPGSSRRT